MKTNTFHAKKVLVAFFAVLLPMLASAQTKVEIDGIWYNLVSKVKQAEVTEYGGIEYSGSITIPATVTHNGVEYSVTSIGDKAFRNCRSLTAITLPEDVTSIGDYAFEYCTSLTAITIPENSKLTSIGGSAFEDCSRLTAITIPENSKLTSIGEEAFYYCSSLTAITLPEGVTSIGNDAFGYCRSLTAINIPEGVTSIERGTFEGCSSLTAINIPEGVTSIGEWAFGDCTSLTAITIPEGVTSIGAHAFSGCSSLTAITIPEGVTSIGEGAFSRCSSLTSVHISSLEVWCNIDFANSSANPLSSAKNLYLNGALVTELTIPNSVTAIKNCAFYGCSSLTAITLPEGVTSIGDRAFEDCTSLKELTLGKGLKKIGVAAFYGCDEIEKVTTYATRPPTAADINIFSDATYENATLYVPQGCIDKYEVMTGWSGFYTIEEMEGGTPNYLTLRQADNGEVGIVVELGRTYKVHITAFEGWKIHTVTFNGEDVTSQLTEEGTFTTPALQDDAVLNIAYEKIDDAIESTRAGAIKVQGHQSIISISGTTEGTDISLYTTSGTLVATATAEGDTTQLTVPTGQVYIVKVADAVVKIGM